MAFGLWLHRFFNPHCPHCKEERVCPSCEILKQELEIHRVNNQKLLERILTPETPPKERDEAVPMTTLPRRIPWAVRQQMLEQEDKKRAELLRNAPTPRDVEDLERELDIAAATREAQHSTKSGTSA